MRKAARSLALLTLLTAGVWAQQQGPAPSSTQAMSAVGSNATLAHDKNAGAPTTCPAKFDDSLGSNGIANKGAEGVTPPGVKSMPEAEITDKALRAKREKHVAPFDAVVNFIVDLNGIPQEICLMQAAGYGLDAEAVKAVRQYRFEPATKDGKPVPFRTDAEIRWF